MSVRKRPPLATAEVAAEGATMSDVRRHRGAHPEDAPLFAPALHARLHRARAELAWLLDRGYALTSALALVGNRHELRQRQRLALARSTCTAAQRARRRRHQIPVTALAGSEVWIDGYNLLITIESALGAGVLLRGRDGCYRDLASLHGTYRAVEETLPALRLIGEELARWHVSTSHWLLDEPVSNSGRLRAMMQALADEANWAWDVALDPSPDRTLVESNAIVLTSDSVILDRCERWCNGARAIIDARLTPSLLLDLETDPPDELLAGSHGANVA